MSPPSRAACIASAEGLIAPACGSFQFAEEECRAANCKTGVDPAPPARAKPWKAAIAYQISN
ncbi:hypothetical protein AMC87_PD00206 (plasmid) [Rhizobium phaseoli]|uniref:Uncharacterized protein n=1 Tax=Rhizobium etli (strain CIAT 652) TaxID=491916 RepID=B3Q4Y0_RHIE6|nr:hypothetical protein RHECIAT_PC0000180 [Rhizobium etli CIAT 652]ANL50333.1 hypothetical protein AMC87_PD00206 [Rhizobium phaseoli]PCD68432.1 hypothetical protein CO648_05450 [Rhizobium phaseoli]PDS72025.1 hypothetical protein CO651_11685 [Rhizobium phaseoli]PWI51828.1 hypothetical protein B5K03_23200 [Rhizobium phaseoli]